MKNDIDRITGKRCKIEDHLANMRYPEAIEVVNELLDEASLAYMKERSAKMIETFGLLVEYMLKGYPDESREMMLKDIEENVLTLADLAVRAIRAKETDSYYYSSLRFSDFRRYNLAALVKEYGEKAAELTLVDSGSVSEKELRKNKEELLDTIFHIALTALGETTAYEDLSRYLLSGYADPEISVSVMSAFTISATFFYDRGKLKTLLDVFEKSEDPALSARALFGILMFFLYHSDRIRKDRELVNRLSLWNDSIATFSRLKVAVRTMVGTHDTERLSHTLRDKIMPDLMKIRPEMMDILKKTKEGEIDAEELMNNPEWEELLAKKGLSKKMEELNEMVSQGADTMMLAFSNLKQFPFFNSAANWFLPFDEHHSALKLEEDASELMELMSTGGIEMCDSDMYSLAFATTQLPASQRRMMLDSMKMQLSQLKDQMQAQEPHTRKSAFDKEMVKVVRDFYRFFKLFRKKEGFRSPFDREFNFYDFPVLGPLLQDEEIVELVAEFYFSRGYYSEALPVLRLMAENAPQDATILQKIGFCYQSQGNLQDALAAYEQSALLDTPGLWLLRKLAYVNKLAGNEKKALKYYQSVLEAEPESIPTMLNTAHLLVKTGNYAEALQHYYHAHYLSPDTPKVMRGLAWTELLNGNLEKSKDIYGKLLSIDPVSSDYMHLGYLALIENNFKEAVNYYSLAGQENAEDLRIAFSNDLDVLVRLGVSRPTALLIFETALRRFRK